MASLDGKREEEDLGFPEWADPLSEEEMEDYMPLSGSEVSQALDLVRRFGVANFVTDE